MKSSRATVGHPNRGADSRITKLISIVTVIGRGFKPDVEKNFLAKIKSRRIEPRHVGFIRMPRRVSVITVSVTGPNCDAGDTVGGD